MPFSKKTSGATKVRSDKTSVMTKCLGCKNVRGVGTYDTPFFDFPHGLFALILPYFAFILPFYFFSSHFLSPFFLFLSPFFLFPLHFPPFSRRLFIFFPPDDIGWYFPPQRGTGIYQTPVKNQINSYSLSINVLCVGAIITRDYFSAGFGRYSENDPSSVHSWVSQQWRILPAFFRIRQNSFSVGWVNLAAPEVLPRILEFCDVKDRRINL